MLRRLLVLGPSWLGDAVMAVPVFRGLRRAFPSIHVTVLARASIAGIYRCVPEVDDTVVYHRAGGAGRLLSFASLVGRLQQVEADAALLIPRSFGAAWTALLAGVPRRIGYSGSGRDLLLTDVVRREPRLLATHRVHCYLHLLGALGVEPALEAPRLVVPADAEPVADRLLRPLRDHAGGPLVALNPGARYGTAKQWPEERYAELARQLRREFGCRIVLVGGPGDHDVCDRIRHEVGAAEVLDLSGRTSIPELAAVLQRVDLMVTNDTGAMHVAAALDRPVVAVFGSTDPVTTAPYGSGHAVVREPVSCSPCLLRTCPIDHRCMVRIEVERVAAACRPYLAGAVAHQRASG